MPSSFRKTDNPPAPGQDLAVSLAQGAVITFHLPGTFRPMRLDAALGLCMPELGIRARRRLWSWCRINVNGKVQKPGFILGPGDCICITSEKNIPGVNKDILTTGKNTSAATSSPDSENIHALLPVAISCDYIALYKNEGLHSAHIEGGCATSLEKELADKWHTLKPALQGEMTTIETVAHPGFTETPENTPPPPSLLTRLDRATSGLVLAALSPEAENRFRAFEKSGDVRKVYLALIHGHLRHTLHLKQMLNMDGGKASRIPGADSPDPSRHSHVEPLCVLEKKELLEAGVRDADAATLAVVHIARGARHQIRAHLAYAGYPIVGEWLYGDRLGKKKEESQDWYNHGEYDRAAMDAASHSGEQTLFLHHAKVAFPGFTARCLPAWGFLFPDENGCRTLIKKAMEAIA